MTMNAALRLITTMIDQSRRYADEHPDATANQVLDLMATGVQAWDEGRARGTCRRCGQPIVEENERWYHEDAAQSRGCRAASFVAADGWDEALDKTWTAAPMTTAGRS